MTTGRQSVGHPVDVASGTVFKTAEDVSIVGRIDLTWRRGYSTALLDSPPSPLGQGWTAPYFASLAMAAGEYVFVTPEGGTETFADPYGTVDAGGIVRNLSTFQELARREAELVVTRWNVDSYAVERFVFARGRPGEPWPLARVENVAGQALLMLRDPSGRLRGVRQAVEGRLLEFEYDRLGRVAAVVFVSPQTGRLPLASYEYDAAGRLSLARDARGYVDRYEYDDRGRLVREALKDGGVFTFAYDARGRCVRTAGADGYDEKVLRYLSQVGITDVTNSRGFTRRYQWLPTGQIVAEIDPRGGVERTEYDEHSRIVARSNVLGAREEYEYDDRGNRIRITNPVGQTTLIAYNDAHQIVEITNPAGDKAYREYDDRNRMVASVNYEGHRYALRFDYNGNLVEVTDPLGRTLRQSFDASGVRVSMADWEGHVTRYTADAMGRVREIVDPLGYLKRLEYDLLSNLTGVDYPDRTTIRFSYDAGNNLTRVVDRNGDVTQYRFGPCKRLLERIDPLGNVTRFGWSTEPADLETITNARGEVYTYHYNEVGLVDGETGFDGRGLRFEYDAAQNRIAYINALGERTEYERDIGGRLLRQVLPDGEETVYAYDAAGSLAAVRNGDSEIRLERDRMGRITAEVQNGHQLTREYDPTGMVVRLESDLGLGVDFAFDGNCNLSRLEVSGHEPWTLERDARGSEIRRRLPGGTAVVRQHDAVGRLLDQTVTSRAAGTLRQSYRYAGTRLVGVRQDSYRQAGTQLVADAGRLDETAYRYDPLHRVVYALRERGASERFDYDALDNITAATRDGVTEEFRHERGDRLRSRGAREYEYDAQGRLVRQRERATDGAMREWRFAWDALDQLRAVTNPDGETWRYAYDPFGRRIEKRAPDGSRRRFVWDMDHLIHEVDDGGATASWVFDPHGSSPLGKVEGTELFAVIQDNLGTPTEMLNRSGQVVWEADRYVWGGTREQRASTVDCPCRFPGQWFDTESGLHYNRYRYYDPGGGRFISQDPTRLMGAMNLYAYVFDPNTWIDPLGLDVSDVNTTADRTHITYVGSKGGKPYVGYASAPGDISGDDVLKRRYSSGFGAEGLDGAPTVVYRGYGEDLESSQAAKATARGLEQHHYEEAKKQGDVANRQNPVGESNKNKDTYKQAADEELEKQKKKEDGCE